jgi:hypothetical protein
LQKDGNIGETMRRQVFSGADKRRRPFRVKRLEVLESGAIIEDDNRSV